MIYMKLFFSFLMIGALSFGGGYGMVHLVPIFLQPHNLWRSFVYYGQPHGAVKCSSDYAVVQYNLRFPFAARGGYEPPREIFIKSHYYPQDFFAHSKK